MRRCHNYKYVHGKKSIVSAFDLSHKKTLREQAIILNDVMVCSFRIWWCAYMTGQIVRFEAIARCQGVSSAGFGTRI